MIKREIEKIIPIFRKSFPVLAVTGARQTGKTTLIRELFPDYQYYNLEDLTTYDRIRDDMSAYVNPDRRNIIFDEVQRLPDLLSQIQATVDVQKEMGSYIVSGSQNLLLSEKISQTLAGRAAYIELPALTISELTNSDYHDDFHDVALRGFYPAIFDRDISPSLYYEQYLSTYVERDVRQLKNVTNLDKFRHFIALLAGSVGRPFNAASISGNIGISPNTAKDWLSILEATYIVFQLKPYYKNIGKQITKSPKIYFYDIGLLCFLLGVTQPVALETHYLTGSIFENMVIADMKKTIMNQKSFEKLFFYRDRSSEVDLVIGDGEALCPVEIKKSAGYSSSFTKGLRYWTELFGKDSTKNPLPYIIYSGATEDPGTMFGLVNWRDASRILL